MWSCRVLCSGRDIEGLIMSDDIIDDDLLDDEEGEEDSDIDEKYTGEQLADTVRDVYGDDLSVEKMVEAINADKSLTEEQRIDTVATIKKRTETDEIAKDKEAAEQRDNESESTDEEPVHRDLSVHDMIKGIVSRNRYGYRK